MLCRSYLCLDVLVERRGWQDGWVLPAEILLSWANSYSEYEDIWLCAWQAWNPGLAMVGLVFLIWTHAHTIMCVSPKFHVLFPFTGLILLFYLVFYGFLAALFTFTMWVMLQTLNDEIPKYRDQISSPGNELALVVAFISIKCFT